MINETIQLTYENVTQITQSPIMLLSAFAIWAVPLALMILLGVVIKAKSPSGRVSSKPMIAYPNFWWIFMIFFFIQSALILIFWIFPIWLSFE
jgi:hypothetical protein